MMAAHECFANAQRCLDLARVSTDRHNERLLLDLARVWHELATSAPEHADRIERSLDRQ